MTSKEKKLIFISVLAGLLLILSGYAYFLGASTETATREDAKNKIPKNNNPILLEEPPELGSPGSEHAHMTFLMSVNGGFHEFNEDKYFLQSNHAHFHEGDDIVIHKHATGVTLPHFLETLGFQLEGDCLTMDTGRTYCENQREKLSLFVNGSELEDPDLYELRHGDRILLNYGSESFGELKLKSQSVPKVPGEFFEDYKPPEEQ